ncbi:major facilitator superfamily domain-containing protein [Mycena floridula]|nr:major facilitator superfamily domain-containing protein [Mycena floridula]
MSNQNLNDEKDSIQHVDIASTPRREHVEVTQADNKRILRLTDLNILTILIWVYFLQILDKTLLGSAAVFGLKSDAHLVGNQYSTIGSMNSIALLAWQPISSYLLVKIQPKYLMPAMIFLWGSALIGMGASRNFGGLVASRFLLGLFEGACLPLFAILTTVWYRRAEQPMRVASWYGTNGVATILSAALSYGLGHIKTTKLHSYQIIFISAGLLTVIGTPLIYLKVDNNVSQARFLTPEDRKKAVERLRANNTGLSSNNEYKWSQVFEAFLEIRTWLFFAMTLLLNVGASVTNIFGPLILAGIGFDKYKTSLLTMPFGAVQIIVIFGASWVAYNWKVKSIVLGGLILPCIAGLTMLYALDRTKVGTAPLLVAYYLLAFLFGANPLLVSWISANTAGVTKKASSVLFAIYNAAVGAGNIIGPLLFKESDAPRYHDGLKICMGLFVTLFGCICLQASIFIVLNRSKAKERLRNGKKAITKDLSMEKKYAIDVTVAEDVDAENPRSGEGGSQAFLDLTDTQNDEFVYVY